MKYLQLTAADRDRLLNDWPIGRGSYDCTTAWKVNTCYDYMMLGPQVRSVSGCTNLDLLLSGILPRTLNDTLSARNSRKKEKMEYLGFDVGYVW